MADGGLHAFSGATCDFREGPGLAWRSWGPRSHMPPCTPAPPPPGQHGTGTAFPAQLSGGSISRAGPAVGRGSGTLLISLSPREWGGGSPRLCNGYLCVSVAGSCWVWNPFRLQPGERDSRVPRSPGSWEVPLRAPGPAAASQWRPGPGGLPRQCAWGPHSSPGAPAWAPGVSLRGLPAVGGWRAQQGPGSLPS